MSDVKVVINEAFGGFGLSAGPLERLRELGWDGKYDRDIPRNDARLVQTVEQMGVDANGGYADLQVIEIPDGVAWHVHEYDGYESVHEDHRVWDSSGEGGCT